MHWYLNGIANVISILFIILFNQIAISYDCIRFLFSVFSIHCL